MWRRRKGLRATALAEALGVSEHEMRAFETGAARIGPRRLWQLSEILSCPLSRFFGHAAADVPKVRSATSLRHIRDHVDAHAMALAEAYYVVGDFQSRATAS